MSRSFFQPASPGKTIVLPKFPFLQVCWKVRLKTFLQPVECPVLEKDDSHGGKLEAFSCISRRNLSQLEAEGSFGVGSQRASDNCQRALRVKNDKTYSPHHGDVFLVSQSGLFGPDRFVHRLL